MVGVVRLPIQALAPLGQRLGVVFGEGVEDFRWRVGGVPDADPASGGREVRRAG